MTFSRAVENAAANYRGETFGAFELTMILMHDFCMEYFRDDLVGRELRRLAERGKILRVERGLYKWNPNERKACPTCQRVI